MPGIIGFVAIELESIDAVHDTCIKHPTKPPYHNLLS